MRWCTKKDKYKVCQESVFSESVLYESVFSKSELGDPRRGAHKVGAFGICSYRERPKKVVTPIDLFHLVI